MAAKKIKKITIDPKPKPPEKPKRPLPIIELRKIRPQKG